jgi:hypothetical protein
MHRLTAIVEEKDILAAKEYYQNSTRDQHDDSSRDGVMTGAEVMSHRNSDPSETDDVFSPVSSDSIQPITASS